MTIRTTLLALLAALAACTPPPSVLHPVSAYGPAPCDGTCGDTVEVTYLGVGGFLIRHGRDAILTAPFFSTPRLRAVTTFRRIHPDQARIDERVRALLAPDSAGIRALLVGHAHYDHLLDVPYVVERYLPWVTVYGNRSMYNMLAPDSFRMKMVVVEDSAGDWRTPGRWIYPGPDSTVRFMALRSEHAPHFAGIKALRRRQATPRPDLPPTAWTWAEGQTLSYVIDFLDPRTRTPLFRIHYQDSASNPPLGFPPPLEASAAKRFDLAVVCAGSFAQVRDYPSGILFRTAPRHVVVGHWENFFQPQTDSLRVIPMTNAAKFVDRIDAALPTDADRTTPRPGAVLRFCVCRPAEGGS